MWLLEIIDPRSTKTASTITLMLLNVASPWIKELQIDCQPRSSSLEEADDFDMSIVISGSDKPEESPCKLLQIN
jgi:hypothetical protein